jgi:hypothetical protein
MAEPRLVVYLKDKVSDTYAVYEGTRMRNTGVTLVGEGAWLFVDKVKVVDERSAANKSKGK